MSDRGMKKWLPFDSLTDTNKMKHDISKKKIKIEKPILSEDQLIRIDNIIKEAYFNKDKLKIYYYYSNNILTKEGKIKVIDYNKKQIVLSDNTKLYFQQIINVEYL